MNKYPVLIRFFLMLISAIIICGSPARASVLCDSLQTSLDSPENIRSFADYLFGQKDYLRAASEYSKLELFNNDTVNFRIAASLGEMGRFSEADIMLHKLARKSTVKNLALTELIKNRWLLRDYRGLRMLCDTLEEVSGEVRKTCSPLYYASFLVDSVPLPEFEEFNGAFPPDSRDFMKHMYGRRMETNHKSPFKAALLSAIIPGTGKLYAGQTSDGITAFIVTGILGYLAWDNFRSDHRFRAWAFTGLGALFYAGNIYGSAAQAQIFNAEINYNFQNDLNIFLGEKNYFRP